jgi:hypothetical protein
MTGIEAALGDSSAMTPAADYVAPSKRRVSRLCDGYDWRSGSPRECALPIGHRGLCSGDACRYCTTPRSPVERGVCRDCGDDGMATR